jgi:8-oxo-dGTP pyrophosphatase MutT (NUDIX family)
MSSRFSVVPAAYVVFLRGEGAEAEVLLQLRGTTGYMEHHWACAAAGHIEFGESVFAAAAREAEEELGIHLDEADLTPLTAMQRTQPGVADPIEQRVDYFLTARRWDGEPQIMEPGKCLELRWCRLDALPEPVVPHESQVLIALRDGTIEPISTFGF